MRNAPVHDRLKEGVTVVEVKEPEVRAPLIQAFVQRAPGGSMLGISPNAPLSEFVARAPQHPVFRVVETANARVESQ